MADKLSATPRSGLLGFLADTAKASYSPQRTQQMQGLMQFLGAPDVAATLDRLSYGEPLTTGSGWTTQMRPETVGALMSASGAMPSLKGVEAGAATVGRAIAPSVEKWGMRQVEAGTPIGRGLVDLTQGSRSYIDTYHGSPYKFDKFDSSKIGTGEGAQAYGHGLYLAENPKVAKEYQEKLSSTALSKSLADQFGGVDEGIAEMQRRIANYKGMVDEGGGNAERAKSFLKLSEKNLQDLQAMKQGLPEDAGAFYKVDLPDDQVAKMLDWDKPLSEQHFVQKALLNQDAEWKAYASQLDEKSRSLAEDMVLGKKPVFDGDGAKASWDALYKKHPDLDHNVIHDVRYNINPQTDDRDWLTGVLSGNAAVGSGVRGGGGADLYNSLGGGEVAASKLRELGISGIRYLDEGSRSNFRIQNTVKGKPYGEPVSFMTERQAQEYAKEQAAKGFGTEVLPGTSNFVVFPGNEGLLKILERNGKPVQ